MRELPSPRPGETLDPLIGDWRIFQLRRGHRFSTDDLLCAWAASRFGAGALRPLDLGSGVGSVALLTLWHLSPRARMVTVEAQEVSVELARRSVALNGLSGRVEVLHGDLRDPAVLAGRGPFDLVSCSPPYIPPGRGAVSPVPQRAAARIELRGDVRDYLRTAARVLAPGGRVVVVFAAADPRGEEAFRLAGLRLLWRRDVVFRAGRPPLITLLVGERGPVGPARREPPLVVRGPDGCFTPEMLRVRARMGQARAPARLAGERSGH